MSKFWDNDVNNSSSAEPINKVELDLAFLRLDGTNSPGADLNFNGNRGIGVGQPIDHNNNGRKNFMDQLVLFAPELWSGNPLSGTNTLKTAIDKLPKRWVKSYDGLVQERTTNAGWPLIVSTVAFSTEWEAHRAFDSNDMNIISDFATNGINNNWYIALDFFPINIPIWGFSARGRNLTPENPLTWELQGSPNFSEWTTIIRRENEPIVEWAFYELPVANPPVRYTAYRFYCFDSTQGSVNPGLSHFQLYPLMDLVY